MTPEIEQILKQQTITEEEPGTVLRDFQTLLEFIGPEGLPTSGKNLLLPMAKLAELDEQMAFPLRPRMKRPQQIHYPHIHGLYLLLRASGLGIAQGFGKSGRLILNSPLSGQWQLLNPTERYFNLLEAWLCRSEPSMLGDRGGWRGDVTDFAMSLPRRVPLQGIQFRDEKAQKNFGMFRSRQSYQLALLELFGLVEVERRNPREGEDWAITAIRRRPFGDALLELFLSDLLHPIIAGKLVIEQSEHEEDADEESFGAERFGVFQPTLQPYFPEWRNNLVFEPPEFREGLYEFTASLSTSYWRRIAISAYDTLDDLAWAIINAFDFDGDHLYEFTFRDRYGRFLRVGCTDEDEVRTDEMQVGHVPLSEGQSLPFLYDFGASWRFTVKLESVNPLEEENPKPKVVAK
jgi:hypothetical protein